MEKLGLQSPWVTYTNKVREMFKKDPEIKMAWSDDDLELRMYIANEAKAEALTQILPSTKSWGKTTVKITIIPANTEETLNSVSGYTIHDAFAGNPIYSYTKMFKDAAAFGQSLCYVVFKKEVIQWWNDDLNDLFGNANMLAEDIARDIFENCKGIFFCTDVE